MRTKAGNAKRTPAQRELDLILISRLHLVGRTQCEIADEIARLRSYRISRQQVAKDLSECFRRWREASQAPIAEHVASELARLAEIERRAWAQFDRKPQARFLKVIQDCIAARVKLLGLDSPARLEIDAAPRTLADLVLASRAAAGD